MRLILAVLALVTALGAPAAADEEIDLVTTFKIQQTAAIGYSTAVGVAVRNLHKSRADSGQGYCGEVLVEGTTDTYTPFHVLLESENGPSVIRQADYGVDDADPMARLMNDLLRAFGCIE